MRKTHVCPKCRHNRILSIAAIPDWRGGAEPERFNIALIPEVVSLPNSIFWPRGDTELATGRETTAGDVSAAVCRACGYAELYVEDPGSIPIDGDYITELVGPEAGGPYR